MHGRRDKEDPVLRERVRERLAQLLAENAPRRAKAAPEERNLGAPQLTGGPPEFEPSDDDDPELEGHGPPSPGVDRRSFSRAHLFVITALLLLGLLWSGWAVLRARPVALATPALTPVTGPGPSRSGMPAPPGQPPAPTPSAGVIMVHVLGAVRKPGVVTLPERSRVRDALQACGGLRRDAAPGELNLAQILSDGQQVVIGTSKNPSGEVRDDSGATGGGTTLDGSKSGIGEVSLNSATQSQLEQLPGVGPVMAGKIIAWRDEHGRFSRVDELQEIDGIGPKTYAQIAPHVRV